MCLAALRFDGVDRTNTLAYVTARLASTLELI
jgi:hypothetical protein